MIGVAPSCNGQCCYVMTGWAHLRFQHRLSLYCPFDCLLLRAKTPVGCHDFCFHTHDFLHCVRRRASRKLDNISTCYLILFIVPRAPNSRGGHSKTS